MSIGAVLDEAWTLYTRFFLRFFAIALVVFVVINLLYALAVNGLDDGDESAVAILGLVGFATAIVGTTWLQGAFVYAVQDARDGTFDATFGQIFARVSPSIGPLLVAGLLAGLGIALGLLVLIVPGLFLLTIWAVIAPVIVVERTSPFAAFGRSRELVRGFGWIVFAIVIVTGLLSGVAGALLQAAFSSLPRFLEIVVGNTIAQAVVAPFGAIALAITYFRLRAAQAEPAEPASP